MRELDSADDVAAACGDDSLCGWAAQGLPRPGRAWAAGSGVAVRGESRGAGLGSRVCRFLAAELIARHGRAALMVDGWNDAAIRLHRRLGIAFQPIRAARTGPRVADPDPARG